MALDVEDTMGRGEDKAPSSLGNNRRSVPCPSTLRRCHTTQLSATLTGLDAIGTAEIPFVLSQGVNFCRHRLNLLRAHWSVKHGPGIRKAHSPTAAHPGRRNIASTSRLIV